VAFAGEGERTVKQDFCFVEMLTGQLSGNETDSNGSCCVGAGWTNHYWSYDIK
jgi:hypothetical protein